MTCIVSYKQNINAKYVWPNHYIQLSQRSNNSVEFVYKCAFLKPYNPSWAERKIYHNGVKCFDIGTELGSFLSVIAHLALAHSHCIIPVKTGVSALHEIKRQFAAKRKQFENKSEDIYKPSSHDAFNISFNGVKNMLNGKMPCDDVLFTITEFCVGTRNNIYACGSLNRLHYKKYGLKNVYSVLDWIKKNCNHDIIRMSSGLHPFGRNFDIKLNLYHHRLRWTSSAGGQYVNYFQQLLPTTTHIQHQCAVPYATTFELTIQGVPDYSKLNLSCGSRCCKRKLFNVPHPKLCKNSECDVLLCGKESCGEYCLKHAPVSGRKIVKVKRK